MGRYRSLQSIMLAEALKGITDNQTITAYKKDCKGSKEETRRKMSEEDEARFSLIWNALMMDDIDDIKRTLNLSNHLMLKRIKERAEAQKV